MHDSYSSYSNNSCVNNIKINAISGTIVKNYKESFFKKFGLNSDLAKMLFANDGAYIIVDYYTKIPVVILQMMMCGENDVLAEIMYKSDFDKMFEPQKNGGKLPPPTKEEMMNERTTNI